MMIYSLVVEGLIFAQTDVFGEYLPSRSSIEDVMSKIGNPNLTKGQKRIAEQDFCTLSYTIVTLLDKQINADIYLSRGEIGEDLEASRQFMSAIKQQAEMTEFSFWSLMQSIFVMEWYHYIAGNPSGGNLQKISQQTKSMLLIASGEKKPLEFPQVTIHDDYSRLEEYPDFKSANEYFNLFTNKLNDELDNISRIEKKRDLKIVNSILDSFAAINSLAAIGEKKGNRSIPFFCPFCKTHSVLERVRKGTRSCCENFEFECKKAYSTAKTKENRESPASQKNRKSSAKQKLAKRKLVSSKPLWKKASDTPRYCIGCRKRRKVDEGRSCEDCYYPEP
jgi:hypothetical protein